jgi:filamentous hemagglutinin family protein
MKKIFLLTVLVVFSIFFSGMTVVLNAQELPSGETVVSGAISISHDEQSMRIDQSSNQAIIEWQNFDIGQNNSVSFHQPSSNASALNRIISGNPTTLAGTLNANGNVYIVNENGVYFTSTSSITAQSFAASALALSNDDYLQNKLYFSSEQLNVSLASVINKGSITTLDGGFTALLGGAVNNEGSINANLGKVGVGAGQEIILDLSGDHFLQVAVPINEATIVLDNNEEEVDMLIKHAGISKGSDISLKVGTAKNILARAVNIPGELVATTATQSGGVITLGGGGRVVVAGNLIAKENGNINIEGDFVSLGGMVDVSGNTGGNITVSSQGETALSAELNASSTNANGGNIVITSSSNIVQSHGSMLNVSGLYNGGTVSLSSTKDFISSGDISASGTSLHGGRIDIEATNSIRLLSSSIDVSGATQGGLVRVGGSFQGSNNLARTSEQEELFLNRWNNLASINNAKNVLVSDGSDINISSSQGPAGTAVIWSDTETTMLGNINAIGTRGGAVEISSKDTLRHVGLSNINISEGGHLLLDPKNITIGDSASSQNWIYRGLIGYDYANTANNDTNNSYIRKADWFGSAVTTNDTNTLMAVGSWLGDGNNDASHNSGDVYLYQFDDSDFTNASLIGRIGDGYSGSKDLDIDNLEANDNFGVALSFDSDGNRLAIGSRLDDGLTGDIHTKYAGAVYLVSFDDTSYTNPTLLSTIGEGYTGTNDINLSLQGDNSGKAWGKNDTFGHSVALDGDGDRLAVGVPGDEGWNLVEASRNSGSVFLFTFSDTSFTDGKLVGRMGYGYNNAVTPTPPCVSASTCTTLGKDFDTSSSSNWTTGTHDASDAFGQAVSLNDDASVIAIGAPGDDGYSTSANDSSKNNYGAVHLFQFSDSDFSSPSIIGTIGSGYTGTNNVNASLAVDDNFGLSLSLDKDADRMAVGLLDDANGDGTVNAGAVHLYSFSSTNSFTGASLTGTIGSGYTGSKDVDMASYLESSDKFGGAVALDGDGNRLIVGAPWDDGTGNGNPGAVYLFKFDDTSYANGALYSRIGKGYSSTGGSNYDMDVVTDNDVVNNGSADGTQTYLNTGQDWFGRGVALDGDGDRLAIVAQRDDGLNDDDDYQNTGAVYLFTFDDSNFTNTTLKGIIGQGYSGTYSLNLGDTHDHFYSVALDGDGDRLVASQYQGDGVGGGKTGDVFTIKFDDTDFTNPQLVGSIGRGFSGTHDLAISTSGSDLTGTGLALNDDGSRLAIGVEREDGNGDGGSLNDIGAVYLVSFSDTSFSSPTLTGTIGADYTGTNDLDLSPDASVTANRILSQGDYFGNNLSLTKDNKLLAVGATRDDGANSDADNTGAIHLFKFADSDFSTPEYKGSIGKDYSGTFSLDLTSNQLGSAAFDGDGTRLAIASKAATGDDVFMIGFDDTNLTNPTLKFTLGYGQTDTNELDVSDHGLANGDTFGASLAMDDYGKLLVVGATNDDGANNASQTATGSKQTGAVYLFSETTLEGLSYTDFSSSDLVVNATELKELLNDNVNVTLQANTDITVNSALTVTGTGTLNLHAGRDVDINKTIDTAGNLQIIASDTAVDVVDAQRDSGAADILAAYESDGSTAISITASDLDIQLRDGSGVTNASMGNIELATVTATTGNLQSANFVGTGAVVADKDYDGSTTATITTDGTVSGLTLVGSDLSLAQSAEFLTASVGADKDVTVDYNISGFTSSEMNLLNGSGDVEESVTADINSTGQDNDTGVQEEESEDKITIKEKIDKKVFDDLLRIVSFISVDGTSSATLLQQQIIKSFTKVDAMSIQRL